MKSYAFQLKPFDKIQQGSFNRTNTINQPLLPERVPSQAKRQRNLYHKRSLYSLKDLCCGYKNKYTIIKQEWNILYLLPVVSPQNPFILIWNLFIQLWIVYVFLMIPLVIFFGEQAFRFDVDVQVGSGFIINIFLCILFFVDMILRFCMAYYENYRLIINRRKIYFNYLKPQFFVDLISTIVLVLYVAGRVYDLVYVKIIFYIKIYSLYKINQTVIKVLQGSKVKIILYMFIRLILITWLLNTWSASVFFAIDYNSYQLQDFYFNSDSLWLTNSQLVSSLNLVTAYPDWYIWYQYALYWSIQTGATTGYGTLTGKNPRQITFSNFVMFFMTVYFAFFINSVWQIINNIQQSDEYNEKWSDLKLYTSQLPLNYEEKRKISNYMIEAFKDDQKNEIQQFIVKNVPAEVKDQFYMSTRQKFYLEENYFSFIFRMPNYTQTFLRLAYQLEQARYSDQQYIYSQGQIDPYFYYAQNGFVKLQLHLSPTKMHIFGKIINNCHFGSEQFFTRVTRQHNAIAVTFVRVWKLNYLKMRKIFKDNIEKNSVFFQQEQNIQILRINDQLNRRYCYKCLTNDHFFYDCKSITFQRDDDQFYAKQLKQNDNRANRRSYKRVQGKQKIMRKVYRISNMDERTVNVDCVKNYPNYRVPYNIILNKKYQNLHDE